MKKLKISRASTAAILIIVLVLVSTAMILVADRITSYSPGEVFLKSEELVRSNNIGTESSSSKNDGVLDAKVVVDIDLLKEQNHNNKQEDEVHNDEEDKVHNDKENDPIANSTEIMAEHIKTETNDTEISTDQGANIEGRKENKPIVDSTHESQDEVPVHETITAPKQTERKNRNSNCCDLKTVMGNAGHTFTDIPFHLSRCGPAVHIQQESMDIVPFKSKVLYLLEIFNKTTTTRKECLEYYEQFPEQHPKEVHKFSFGKMARLFGSYYDAYEVGRELRKAQKVLLSSCGLKPPIFKHTINIGENNLADGRAFEEVERTPPATRVIIAVRRPVRILMNAEELMIMCTNLNVNCKIIYMDEYWSNKETSDLCYVLKTFENSVVIAMQGAEIVYPLLLGVRQILVSPTKNKGQRSGGDLMHYGTAQTGEIQSYTNLVQSARPPVVLEDFFTEFALHFGSELNAVSGKMYDPRDSVIPNKMEIISKNTPCVVKEEVKKHLAFKDTNIQMYCLDMDADVGETKAILENYIRDGHLLLESEL